jgi:CRISPR/Cas system-associated protein Csm6
MGTKKLEQDLRDAGLRKKRARKVAKAADRGRAGDREARKLVEKHSTALRDSVSAVVSHAQPPRSRSTKKASPKKSSAKRSSTKRAHARRSTSKSTARKAPTKKVGSGRGATTRGRTTRTPRGRPARRRSQSAR